jgi:hypothetical protein
VATTLCAKVKRSIDHDVLLGFPFVIIFTLLTLVWGRKTLSQRPLVAFFFVASLVAAVLFVGWGVYWRGFPEFTQVGLI